MNGRPGQPPPDGTRAVTSLRDWGWDDGWARALAAHPRGLPGRIVMQERTEWTAQTEEGPRTVRAGGGRSPGGLPAVGDWAVLHRAEPEAGPWWLVGILERRSKFSRGSAGTRFHEQVIAANVDRLWIVHGLDRPVNPGALERYLAVAWESGASPEVVLTKADLVGDLDGAVRRVEGRVLGVPVRCVSTVTPGGTAGLSESLVRGQTVALVGPSGAGKSSLINDLAGLELAGTGEVRPGDRKGRHTTIRRQLFRLEGGALLLDTPGMRELKVWDLDEGLQQAFPEIDQLAGACRFRDCTHVSEPDCAVLAAAEAGALDPDRLESYRKLQREAAYQVRKADPAERARDVAEFKAAMKSLKHHPKYRKRR